MLSLDITSRVNARETVVNRQLDFDQLLQGEEGG